MDTSITLAQIIGPLLLVIGIGVMLNPAHYANMTKNFLENPALYYFSGALAFVIGMLIIIFHNLWVADWRVAITIIGWISLTKGIIRIVLPMKGAKYADKFVQSTGALNAGAVLLLIFGGWVSYQGFGG